MMPEWKYQVGQKLQHACVDKPQWGGVTIYWVCQRIYKETAVGNHVKYACTMHNISGAMLELVEMVEADLVPYIESDPGEAK